MSDSGSERLTLRAGSTDRQAEENYYNDGDKVQEEANNSNSSSRNGSVVRNRSASTSTGDHSGDEKAADDAKNSASSVEDDDCRYTEDSFENDSINKQQIKREIRQKSAKSGNRSRSRSQSRKKKPTFSKPITIDEMLAKKYAELKILLSTNGAPPKQRSLSEYGEKKFPYREAHQNAEKLRLKNRVRSRKRSAKTVNSTLEVESVTSNLENSALKKTNRNSRPKTAKSEQKSIGDVKDYESVSFPSVRSALVRESASTTQVRKEAAFCDMIATQNSRKKLAASWQYKPVPTRVPTDPKQRAAINWLREKHREVKAADYIDQQRRKASEENMKASENRDLAASDAAITEAKLLSQRSMQKKRALKSYRMPFTEALMMDRRIEAPRSKQKLVPDLATQRSSYQTWLSKSRAEAEEKRNSNPNADSVDSHAEKQPSVIQVDEDLLGVHPESARIRIMERRTRLRSAHPRNHEQKPKDDDTNLHDQNDLDDDDIQVVDDAEASITGE